MEDTTRTELKKAREILIDLMISIRVKNPHSELEIDINEIVAEIERLLGY
jgi:hypothetical protein